MNQNIPIILFDGICNLCNYSVNFILKRDKKKQFRYVSLQCDEGKKLVQEFGVPKETDSVVFIKEPEVFFESDAAIEIAKMLPAPWKWAKVFSIIPRKIRNKVYNWIARNRYKWFGTRESCRII